MTRPRVTLKIATSLDGRIALATGESRWITGEAARAEGHRLRSRNDAVLVGIGTALQDDPALTVRLPGHDGVQPMRVVLDTHLRLPPAGQMVRSAREIPVVAFCGPAAEASRRMALEAAGVRVATVGLEGGSVAPAAVLDGLLEAGVGSLLIEGGGRVAGAFLAAGLVDALIWFRAPILIGAEGAPAIGPLGLEALRHAPTFARTEVRALGPDLMESYERS